MDYSVQPRRIEHILLVSGSPRRRALLTQLGLSFDTWEPSVDEMVEGSPRPSSYVRIVAKRKLLTYIERNDPVEGLDEWALAADTIVALGRRIIGKPEDRAEAAAILRLLSGRSHRVITAMALFNPHDGSIAVNTSTTHVKFARLTDEEIEWYLQSEEWKDAAGAYRIQERGSVLVRSIRGSYSNVVGLPIQAFYGMVQAQGFRLFPSGNK